MNQTRILTKYFNEVLKEFENDIPSVKVKKQFGKSKKKIYTGFNAQLKNKKKHWNCFYCTFANPKRNKKCSMCLKKKKILR